MFVSVLKEKYALFIGSVCAQKISKKGIDVLVLDVLYHYAIFQLYGSSNGHLTILMHQT